MVMHDDTAKLPGQDQFPPEEQDQDQLQAHLLARGQQVAQDMDLGQVQPHDLIDLGRLDILGRHPDTPQDLALVLDLLTAERDHDPHREAREQARQQALDQLLTPRQPAPDPSLSPESDISDIQSSGTSDLGQVARRTRRQRKIKQTKLRDPRLDYPDEEWS
jgi:hypothetical protein